MRKLVEEIGRAMTKNADEPMTIEEYFQVVREARERLAQPIDPQGPAPSLNESVTRLRRIMDFFLEGGPELREKLRRMRLEQNE